MKVRIAKSIKMPTLYGYFVSNFNDDVLDYFNSKKPFTIYHRELKEYEVTKEIYKEVATSHDLITDERETLPVFVRSHNEKYGYQKDAVDFARKTRDMLVNFPQGTGKSRTVMMIIDDQDIKKTLIICGQANLQEEWIKDANKHNYRKKLNFNIIGDSTDAPTSKKVKWILEHSQETGVDLINIEAMRNVGIIDALNKVGYGAIVIDEVQSAKGWKAKQTVGLHSLDEKEDQLRIALSGTPILNGPLEFFSVLRFLRQLKNTARTTYERHYGEWKTDFWGHFICAGFKNIDDLQELLRPIIAYVDKKELGLPPKRRLRVPFDAPLSDELKYLEKALKMTTPRMKREGFTSKPQIRAQLQLATSTADVKIDYIMSFKDKRLLVFSQYVEALKAIQSQLTDKGKKVLLYTGELNMAQRLEVLGEWITGEYDILLLSIMAARYGLNLTEATDVIFMEPPQSLAVLEQAEDRSHRIGQEFPVMSHLLVWGKGDQDRLDNIVNKQEAIDEVYEKLRT